MLNEKTNARCTVICEEMEELLFVFSPEEIARECDRQAELLMCINDDISGDRFFFLKEMRNAFNRMASRLGQQPYVPGVKKE